MADDARLFAPSAGRNRQPILDAIGAFLPEAGLVLEVASGTGEHVAFFAAARPALIWQPTDPDAERRRSIDAWCAGLPNVRPALALDASADWATYWPAARADAVICINMIHISPWPATEGLFAGAGRVLPPGGVLALYGPFRRRGVAMEAGNAAFDADLKQRDPRWGLREVGELVGLAGSAGFDAPTEIAMPADNWTLVFRRR